MLPDVELLQFRSGYFIYVRYFIICLLFIILLFVCLLLQIALIQHYVTVSF